MGAGGGITVRWGDMRGSGNVEDRESGGPADSAEGSSWAAWAFEGDCHAESLRSTTFSLEWPPRSGRHQNFPEVDRAGWFGLEEAKRKILPGQVALLNELAAKIL